MLSLPLLAWFTNRLLACLLQLCQSGAPVGFLTFLVLEQFILMVGEHMQRLFKWLSLSSGFQGCVLAFDNCDGRHWPRCTANQALENPAPASGKPAGLQYTLAAASQHVLASGTAFPGARPSPQAAVTISFYSGWSGVLVSKLRASGTPVESGSEEENQQCPTFCLNEFTFVCPLQKTKCPHPQFLSVLALQCSSPPVLASLN